MEHAPEDVPVAELTDEEKAAAVSKELSLRARTGLLANGVYVALREQSRIFYGVAFLPVLAYIVGFAVSHDEAQTEFYAASAGVIATLLLTLAIQAAWFRYTSPPDFQELLLAHMKEASMQEVIRRAYDLHGAEREDLIREGMKKVTGGYARGLDRWSAHMIYGLILLAALLVGEMFALVALMDPTPAVGGEPRPVLAAACAGLVGVAIVAIFGTRENESSKIDQRLARIEELLRDKTT